jgi:Holliday junction DNA helicase RuvB
MQEVDEEGLDPQDRRYLLTLIQTFRGGPAGVEAIAATMSVSSDTLADEVEPYLLRRGFVVRSSRGRQATPEAYGHIGIEPEPRNGGQGRLF